MGAPTGKFDPKRYKRHFGRNPCTHTNFSTQAGGGRNATQLTVRGRTWTGSAPSELRDFPHFSHHPFRQEPKAPPATCTCRSRCTCRSLQNSATNKWDWRVHRKSRRLRRDNGSSRSRSESISSWRLSMSHGVSFILNEGVGHFEAANIESPRPQYRLFKGRSRVHPCE